MQSHTYQGSTVRPGCCIVLMYSGGPDDGNLWDGSFGTSEMIRRCGLGPNDPVHENGSALGLGGLSA